MIAFFSKSTLKLISETAKAQAVAGAAAGATLGAFRSIATVRRNQFRDGYDVVAEGMTQIGTGAALGVVGAMAASVTGVTLAAVTGRSVLTAALPAMASVIASKSAHERVDRLFRPVSKSFAGLLRWALHDNDEPQSLPQLPLL